MSVAANELEHSEFAKRQWRGVWNGTDLIESKVRKVLTPMHLLLEMTAAPVIPLLLFWTCLHPEGMRDCWFLQPMNGVNFSGILKRFEPEAYNRKPA